MDSARKSIRGVPLHLREAPMRIKNVWFVIGAMVISGAALAPNLGTAAGVTQTVTVSEGTNIAATVSADQSTIIMDLQGVLWSLPIGGGAAIRLTDDFLEPAPPTWSARGYV